MSHVYQVEQSGYPDTQLYRNLGRAIKAVEVLGGGQALPEDTIKDIKQAVMSDKWYYAFVVGDQEYTIWKRSVI